MFWTILEIGSGVIVGFMFGLLACDLADTAPPDE